MWCQHVSLFQENFHPLLQLPCLFGVHTGWRLQALVEARCCPQIVCAAYWYPQRCVCAGESLLWAVSVWKLLQPFFTVPPCFAVLCQASDHSSSSLLHVHFHHGLLPHHTALKRWEQLLRHGWYQLCPKHSSLPEVIMSPELHILPVALGGPLSPGSLSSAALETII